jgi:peptidoglycan/LPS O-acetylase OafA/YrhL
VTGHKSPGRPAPKLAGIEAARGVAACSVVFYHAARHMDAACHVPAVRALLQFGHAGVDVFFVLSGFIILFVHFDDIGQPSRLWRYVSRRATRLLPVYWVALALTILLRIVAGHEWPSLFSVLWSGLLLPSWSEPLLGVAWTLQFEVVFYAMFAVLILNRRAGIFLMAAWLLCIVVVSVRGGGAGVPPCLCSAYDLEFFLGMGVAVAARRGRIRIAGPLVWGAGGFFALICLCEDLRVFDGYGNWARVAYGVPAALLIFQLAATGSTMPRPLAVLGAASYSIYLFQFFWIALAWQAYRMVGFDRILPCAWGVPLLAAGGIVGGVLMSRGVEYPLMELLRARKKKAVLF